MMILGPSPRIEQNTYLNSTPADYVMSSVSVANRHFSTISRVLVSGICHLFVIFPSLETAYFQSCLLMTFQFFSIFNTSFYQDRVDQKSCTPVCPVSALV